jgi:hypothetical protein
MSKTKHTPAPWYWQYLQGRRVRLTTNAADVFTAALTDIDDAYIDIDEADARLIAAAPTMYDYIKAKADAGDAEAQAIMEAVNANT